MSSQVAKAARRVTHELHGVVVSAGLMDKTVKVRVGGQKWNKIVNKWFADPKHYLVHDPNTSLRTGDVVSIVPGWPTSQHKRHVIKHIIAPYGTPITERPPVPTLEERIADREAKKAAKDERRAVRRQEEESKIQEEKRLQNEKKEAKRRAWEAAQEKHKSQTSASDVD
ncbi:Ff.00g055720.m01.CDS01 [Fusarium sp. VM40]|nr:Ff.00g055720.m01.CDS01 [Fusarium sp. VM40]